MKKLLFIMALVLSLVSCTSRSERLEEVQEPTFGDRTYPVYHLVDGKVAFEFEDKQDMLKSVKRSGSDSLLLSRTTIIHSYLDGNNYYGDWIIPSMTLIDTTYQEIDGKDTMTVIIETKQFLLKPTNVRLVEYKEDKPY